MRIEQTIGRLKNHFAYLKEIPNKGNLSQDQLKEIYIWIALVVILHNLLQTEDPWLDVELAEEDDADEKMGRGAHDELREVNAEELCIHNRGMLRRQFFLIEFLASEREESTAHISNAE